MATTYKTSNEGAFNFAGKSYKITGDSSVTFYLDDNGSVYAVSDLDGTITADFENTIAVNGFPIQISGDNNNSVSVTADSEGISVISGVNGDEVTISNFANASTITTTSSGTFTFGSATFILNDKAGASFLINEGSIGGIEDLSGSVTGDFSSGLTVNGTPVQVAGGNVTVTASGDSVSVAVNSGSFSIANRSFTIDGDNTSFLFNSDGTVTGVYNLKGAISFKSNGLPFSVNGTSLTVGVNDFVTVHTDDNGNITGISGLDTYVSGLPANTTIAASDKNITVNGTAISINEGTNTNYILALNAEGVPTQASALSDGVTVNNVPNNMQFVTDENGAFRIGGRTYSISGNDYNVTFSTDESGKVTAVDNLDGAIYVQGDVTLNVNGYEVAVDKVVSAGDNISIYAGSNGIYNVYGLTDGDSVSGDLDGAAVSLPPNSSLFINGHSFRLDNDSDGVIIIPNTSNTFIKYLSAGATLFVDTAGTYLVSNDDDETVSLTLNSADSILADDDGFISSFNSNDFAVSSSYNTDEIINAVAKQPSNYVNLKSPLTTFDSDINYDLNLVFYLNNSSNTPANYDFSNTAFRKRVSLIGGEQNLTLNSAGDNIVVLPASASGDKNIFLGNSGDIAVVDSSSANISIHSGISSDFILSKSDISIYTNNDGATKFTPLNDSAIKLFNYGVEEFYGGAGVQTAVGKVLNAVKSGTISFSDGTASVKGYGSVVFYNDTLPSATFANFYDKYFNLSKVAFNNIGGGTVDATKFSDDLIIKGNYFGVSDYQGSLLGGKGNDTILAGDGDSVNAGAGNNFIELSKTRSKSAVIFVTSKTSNDTIKNFKFGTNSTADVIRTEEFYIDGMTLSDSDVVLDLRNAQNLTLKDGVNKSAFIENDYVDNPVAVQFGNQNLTINNSNEYYWAGGSDVTVEVGNYRGDSLLIDLNNDNFQDREHLRFNGDIKAVDASNYRGATEIIGNNSANIITAATGNTTLNGGAGNDTLIGGAGADVFIFETNHGEDNISAFDFENDKIDIGGIKINSVTADSLGNATLKLSDGNLKIENAVGKIIKIESEEEEKSYSIGESEIDLSKEADIYWAGGSNATVLLKNYSKDEVKIDLSGKEESTEDLRGEIRNVNAEGYEGEVTIIGDVNANEISLGGGAGYIKYNTGGGNDTIYGAKSNDTLEITGGNYSTLMNGEDIEVTAGKNKILIKGAATTGIEIKGTLEGNASKQVLGTSGDDIITNTVSGAIISGLGGDDSITNSGNRVTIEGGAGKDTINNKGTNSELNGGGGDDVISNSAQTVTLQGGTGYDTLVNSAGNVSMNGGDGNDRITNEGAKVTIIGGKGADSILNSGATSSITGGDSRDSILSSGANVTINGGDGEDFISLSGGKKLIEYHNGDDDDTISGISADDTIKITGAKYSSIVSGQNIKIKVGDSAILLRNAVNVDFKIEGTLESAEEANVLKGTAKVDTLKNAEDEYIIYGLGGSDKISNSGSSVTIVGGTGNESIVNTGSSVVYQYASGDGDDTIYGFTPYDTLQITRGTIKSSLATGTDFILYIGAGSVTFNGIAGDAKINVMDTSGKVETITVGKLVQGTNKGESLANSKNGYQIEGYGGNDRLYNYGDEVTIIGGTGNDTIVNKGNNVEYRYSQSEGKDVITGYKEGDTINITRGIISSSLVSGKDIILKIGSGSITLKDLEADTVIKIKEKGEEKELVVPRLKQGSSRADTLTNEEDGYEIEVYGGGDKVINEGNSNTITGGAGNDTIRNSGNKNIYRYGSGDGKDVIIGYSETDTLEITKGEIKSSSVSGEDFILNIGSGSVTFKGIAKGSKIQVKEASGKTQTITVPKIKQGTAKNDTLTNKDKEYEIEGLGGNDSITNSGADVTLTGGKGNDTLTNSGNRVIYKYAAGDGKDVITNFGSTDTLHVTSGSIKSTLISGNDLILNIGTGSITVKEKVGSEINLKEGEGKVKVLKVPYVHMLTPGADKYTNEDAKYLVEGLEGGDTLENFGNNATVDGGAGKDYLYNSGVNSSLNGGAGNDSIDNFASNSTLNGGAGNDTINNTGLKNVYEYESGGGKDIIIGYGSTDTVNILSGKIKTTNVNGMDVTLNIGSGSITLLEAAGKTLNIKTSGGEEISTVYSGKWEGTANADNYSNSANNIMLRGLGGNDSITNYGSEVTINGGAGHDIITPGTGKKITIIGGAGNDTIKSSNNGGIMYQYAGGDGKDVITGFSKKDTLQVTSGTVKSVKTSGGNTVITIGTGTITLEKYTSAVNMIDKSGGKISVSSKKVSDLFEDNNYISGEINLEEIIESKYEVTQLQGDKEEKLSVESVLTYSEDR